MPHEKSQSLQRGGELAWAPTAGAIDEDRRCAWPVGFAWDPPRPLGTLFENRGRRGSIAWQQRTRGEIRSRARRRSPSWRALASMALTRRAWCLDQSASAQEQRAPAIGCPASHPSSPAATGWLVCAAQQAFLITVEEPTDRHSASSARLCSIERHAGVAH